MKLPSETAACAAMMKYPALTWEEAEQVALAGRPEPPFHDLTDAEIIGAVQCYAGPELWSGRHVGDHSQADLALCNELAKWCGPDHARIDALFRESGLYRGKWEREDYRRRTIALACNRASFIGWDKPVPRGVRKKRAS
jgi:hypothetical protein